MTITLAGTLLRIQWQLYADKAIEAEIVRRLKAIPTTIAGNQPRTWYVHLNQLEAVQEAFPLAQYSAEVWAAYPPKAPLGKLAQPVQGNLIDDGDRVFEWKTKGKHRRRKAKA